MTVVAGDCCTVSTANHLNHSTASELKKARQLRGYYGSLYRGYDNSSDTPRRRSTISTTPSTRLGLTAKLIANIFSSFSSGYSCFSLAFVIFVIIQRLANAQHIETQPQTFQVRVGDRALLPCTFTELNNDDTVITWKRGNDLITVDEELSFDDNRFQVQKNGMSYVLEISAVESYDSGSYTCSVTSNPPVEITHRLQVNVPPSVKLIPSTSLLQARAGEEIIIKCVGMGNPPPSITWKTLSGGRPVTTSDGRLVIASATPSDSGNYECRATNNVGDDAVITIKIHVENLGGTSTESSAEQSESTPDSAPWAETDQTYIAAKLGQPANLSCRYDGQPEPNADWLFSGFKINNFDSKFKGSAKFGSVAKNYSITTFAISEVREDHFGDYTCKISNRLGTVERTIHLSGRPGPPVISVLSDNSLSWTVPSAKPIFEYKIHYRLASEDMWTHNKIVPSSKNDQQGEYWTHKVPLSFLNADTDYEIQVEARNELGWGSLARDFVKYHSSSASGKISSNVLNVNAAISKFDGFKLCAAAFSMAIVVFPALFIL